MKIKGLLIEAFSFLLITIAVFLWILALILFSDIGKPILIFISILCIAVAFALVLWWIKINPKKAKEILSDEEEEEEQQQEEHNYSPDFKELYQELQINEILYCDICMQPLTNEYYSLGITHICKDCLDENFKRWVID